MIEQCLQGYRVLDLSQYLPGPYATRMLADLGAEVVKVEPPSGDPMRQFIFLDEDKISPLYKQVNAGKTIVRIDLKSDSGCALFRQMLAAADVLLESYRPGVLDRLGFTRNALHSLNPTLIHCALSGFGQDGPYAQRAGHDITYMALSGMLSHTGTPERPVAPFPPVSDYAGGQQAAAMIIAALLRREKLGRGGYIDTSLFEAAFSWQSFGLAGIGRPGRQLEPGQGLITGGLACYQIYQTADHKFVVLGALEEKFWAAFCRAVGHADWVSRQREPMPQTGLIAEVRRLFAGDTRRNWVQRLAAADCCFEPLLEPEEAVRHEQVSARRLIEGRHGACRPVDVRLPIKFNGHYPRERNPLREVSASSVAKRWDSSSGEDDKGTT